MPYCSVWECKNNSRRTNLKNGGISYHRILVYKKIYHESVIHNISSNSSRSLSPPFRSSSLESEESQKSNETVSPALTDYFKSHCLKLILNLVKDKKQTRLVFSGLTTLKAEFVHSIIKSVITDNSDSVDVKKNYPQLWEAVKILHLKYNFSIKYWDSTINKQSLLLERMEKNNASVPTEVKDLHSVSSMSVTCKSLKKHNEAIKHLSEEFIITSLKKVNKLLQDEREASLIFSSVNAKYARFLNNIVNYCRSSKIKALFSKEAQQLFNEIQISDAMKHGFRIKIKQSHVGGGDKYPLQETTGLSKNNDGTKRKKIDTGIASTESEERAVTNIGHKYGTNIDFQYAGDLTNVRDKSSLVLEGERDAMLFEAMMKHSMAVFGSVEMPESPRRNGSKRRGSTGRQPRTSQLIEALSVPVKSDKALKMMLGMGWKGGALGSRGDGITEPIMPDLNIVAGAGLGHFTAAKPSIQLAKPPPSIPTVTLSCNKKDSFKFRQLFLGQLFELLTSSEDTRTVRFHPMLKKKEKSFMRHCMRCFAERMPLKLCDDEQNLVDKILVQYIKDPELVVLACIADDNKEVVLKKSHSIVTPVNRKEYAIPPGITDSELYPGDIQRILDGFGPLCQTKRALEKSRFRVTILLELLRFIKNIFLDETVIKLDKEMTIKQKYYVESCTSNINKRLKFGATGGEAAMSREIKKYMGDFNLILKINHDLMSFHISKQYVSYKSDQTNTATVTTINKRKTDYNYIKDVNDDLYIEDDIKISDDTTKTHKVNEIVYKSQENENYDNNMSDYKDFDNYSDTEGLINGNRNENIRKNDDIIIEYDDLTTNADISTEKNKVNNNFTEKSTENRNNTEKITENYNTTEETRGNYTIVAQSTKNHDVTTTDCSKGQSIKYNKSTTKQTTHIGDLDSNNKLDMNDKMSISDSNDYSVLGIDETSMSEDILTDWDDSRSDISIKLNNESNTEESIPKLAEIKKKQLKKEINKINIDIKMVSLSKWSISAENLLKHIQHIISYNIIKSDIFPLLKCYGVHNGIVKYSCHDKKSYQWLLEICGENDIILVNEYFNKMSFKINWFYDKNDNYVFDMLDMYNENINTDDWSVIKREKIDDNMLFVVKMDSYSFDFILKSDLTLFAGVDKVQFSVVWE